MTLEEQQYFRDLRDMFATPGWKVFMEECQLNAENIDHIEECKTLEDMWFRRGQLAAIANILHLERFMERAEEEMEADSDPSGVTLQ